jgi:CheY-like chemotaxis protein
MSDPDRPGISDCDQVRVAVIDDNLLVLSLLREMLERADREVVTFGSPWAALIALAASEFDVVLCDINMPGMSGIELYHRLRASNLAYGDRVIFLTGDRLAPETERFLAGTKCSCLCKPCRRGDLERVIGRIVMRSGDEEPPLAWREAA